MELATEQRPPIGLRLARHAVGMCIVALANPLIYFDASPFEQWAMLPVGAVAIAAALFGVLALISPGRAKAAWPATPIKSAWFILALMLFSNWQGYRAQPTDHLQTEPAPQEVQPRHYTDEEVGFPSKR